VDPLAELVFWLSIFFATEEFIDGDPGSSLLVYFSGVLGIREDGLRLSKAQLAIALWIVGVSSTSTSTFCFNCGQLELQRLLVLIFVHAFSGLRRPLRQHVFNAIIGEPLHP
jgi:hypothetical protein